MAKKHVEEYFLQICAQYNEMLDNLKDLEKEANEGLLEPERLDNFKRVIEPLKNNYMTLSWIMYLLNQPNKESKKDKYIKRTKKQTAKLDKTFNKENVLLTNQKVIEKLRK